MNPKLDPNWRVRRSMAASGLLFTAGLSGYAVAHGVPMAEAVLPSSMTAFTAIIVGYVFGAAYERRGGTDYSTYAGGPGE